MQPLFEENNEPKSSNLEIKQDTEKPTEDIEWVSDWYYCCYPFYFYRKKNKDNLYSNLPRFRHLIVTVYPFYICLIFSLITIFYFGFVLFPSSNASRFWLYYFIFCYAMTAISYIIVHFKDPGILPFTWPKTKKKYYSPNELKSGTAVTNEQIIFAQNSERPSRAIFTKKYGYFILRADHECGYLNAWVGLHNHRYFLIGITFGAIYCLSYPIFMFFYYHKSEIPGYKWAFKSIFVILAIFGVLHVMQVRAQFRNVSHNTLIVEDMKGLWKRGQSPFSKDCMTNWEEVCGSRKFMFCWWLPLPIPKVLDGFGYEPYQQKEETQALI